MSGKIDNFRFEHYYLSNFYSKLSKPVRFDGKDYASTEHAYQAAKTLDETEREKIRTAPSPGDAKRLGRRIKLRDDWEDVKLDVMYDIVRQKFFENKDLGAKLVSTGEKQLVEGNDHGDTFWGCDRKNNGTNHLGKILMRVRDELREEKKRALDTEKESISKRQRLAEEIAGENVC
jgi:ribA/ribD-fused uncharacterized protein